MRNNIVLCIVSIEGDDRVMLGRVVMLEDHENGGVTSKTYLNVTLRTYCSHGLYGTIRYDTILCI